MPQAATARIANRISWEYPLASPSPQTFRFPSLREAGRSQPSNSDRAQEDAPHAHRLRSHRTAPLPRGLE
jgi:hypothetical protein